MGEKNTGVVELIDTTLVPKAVSLNFVPFF